LYFAPTYFLAVLSKIRVGSSSYREEYGEEKEKIKSKIRRSEGRKVFFWLQYIIELSNGT
jgi:hypothetical protein